MAAVCLAGDRARFAEPMIAAQAIRVAEIANRAAPFAGPGGRYRSYPIEIWRSLGSLHIAWRSDLAARGAE